jgi:hypothetical protein
MDLGLTGPFLGEFFDRLLFLGVGDLSFQGDDSVVRDDLNILGAGKIETVFHADLLCFRRNIHAEIAA